MQKLAKKLSLAMVALFTVFTFLSYMPAKAAVVAPKVQFVGEQKLEYTAGERITFNLNAANYGGRVQYRVVLWNDATKSYSDLWNTADRYYANWMPYGNETLPLGWVINEPGSYRITVYAKRAGVANSKTALPGSNCDSFVAGPAFVVKPAAPAVDVNYEAAVKAVAAYEAAPLTTLEQVAAAEALKAPATAAIALVTDAAKKAELTAKVTAQDAKVAAAKEALTIVKVVKLSVIDATTLKVTFDKDVTATVKNFNIFEKEDTYAVQYIQSVSVEKNVATVELYDALSDDTDYVLEVKEVKSADGKAALKETAVKEFQYVTAEPAKIEFKSATVTASTPDNVATADVDEEVVRTVKYVIYDKDGNDITEDYSDALITVETSNDDVVNEDLEAWLPVGTSAYAVVNIILDDYEIETGNKIIKVVNTQLKLTSLGRYTIATPEEEEGETVYNPSYTNPKTSLFESSEDRKLCVEVLNQNGDPYNGATLTYKSNNSTVALVNQDGIITPVQTGKATILVTATAGTIVVRKTYEIEVKADPVAKELKVSTSSVKLVRNSDIDQTITVTVLDQYGKVFTGFEADDELEWKIDRTGLAVGAEKYVSSDVTTLYSEDFDADGEATITLTPYAKNAVTAAYPAESITGTGKVYVSFGSLKATVAVSVVNPAAFDGYKAVIDETKIDRDQTSDYSDGAAEATITVYEVDTNGNYIKDVTGNATFEKEDDDKVVIELDENVVVPFDGDFKLGTENVIVKVNNVKVARVAVTVIDSTPVVKTVTQDNDVVQISLADGDSLEEVLFGTDEDGAVFAAKDQYGNKIQITEANLTMVATDNDDVIDEDLFALEGGEGTATLTFKLAGQLYSIVVKVVE